MSNDDASVGFYPPGWCLFGGARLNCNILYPPDHNPTNSLVIVSVSLGLFKGVSER